MAEPAAPAAQAETGDIQAPVVIANQPEPGEAAQGAEITLPEQQPETAEPAPTVDPNTPYGKALANAAARGLPQPPDVVPAVLCNSCLLSCLIIAS